MGARGETVPPGRERARAAARRNRFTRLDVIVVGAGPAGSVLAWELARQGINVLLVDRARFPRDKVCGDYVEPRGLRLLEHMRCLATLEKSRPLPITHSAIFVESDCRYRGRIPFYGLRKELPPHGYIIPRAQLDNALLECSMRAGASVEERCAAVGIRSGAKGVEVDLERSGRRTTRRATFVVGADGVNSAVARSVGLLVDDERHTAVAQRAYAEGLGGSLGEAAFFFDRDMFPGYGWMFPMSGGRANLGAGMLAETRRRLGMNVPQLFARFFDLLRREHPDCAKLRLVAPPIGGVVKTYGGIGSNCFDRGLLVGDAGSFVDPMTGEGITPAMESSLLAAAVIVKALGARTLGASPLSAYHERFRAYFDPAMVFLDLCAASMRNRHFADTWLGLLARGCELAQADLAFSRTAGACFGGLEIRPVGVLAQVWARFALEIGSLGMSSLFASRGRGSRPQSSVLRDLIVWQEALLGSVFHDPAWHASWTLDLQAKWLQVLGTLRLGDGDPRAAGLV